MVVWDASYSFHLLGIPKGKNLMVCWMSFNLLPLLEGLVSPELSNPKELFLKDTLVCMGGFICIFLPYFSIVSLTIIPR